MDFISRINMNNCRFLDIIRGIFFILLLFVGNNGTSGLAIRGNSTTIFDDHLLILSVCRAIQERISNASEVVFPPNKRYFEDIYHHTVSSTSLSVCSVEPGTSVDVAIIMRIIRQKRVPFAVKGGGHTSNPNFSSTTGVHISMRRLCKITYHPREQTVDLGAGLTWGPVYIALEPHNVTVNGGRHDSVGVAGIILGGGYGWKTNQYGLSMDNVIEYELVVPNGTIVRVTNDSCPDLFFGLRGGYNNFGIVTNFKTRVVPQGYVYGGILTYSIHNSEKFDQLINAIVHFEEHVQDPKAEFELVFYVKFEVFTVRLIFNYDAPTAPKDMFQKFLNIDHVGNLSTKTMSEFWTRSFDENIRGRYHSVSSKQLSPRLLRKMRQQIMYYQSQLGSKPDADISILALRHLPTYLQHSLSSAYNPRILSNSVFPICIIAKWKLPSDDQIFIQAMQSIAKTLGETMVEDNQYSNGTKQISYPNFALETTPVSLIYGSNLPRLQSIRKAWDPENVMYLTGGWKI